MGFVESTAAVPAQSTALAADALIFLRESALAWLAMWVMAGAFRRTALIARIMGVVMILSGRGVSRRSPWGASGSGAYPNPCA